MITKLLFYLSLLYHCFVDSSTTSSSSTQISPIFTKILNTEYNGQTYYQFQFNYSGGPIYDGNARIVVTFPEQLTLNYFPSYLDCNYEVDTEYKQVDCLYNNNREVIVYIKNIAQGKNNLAIGKLINPIGITGTSYFKLCIYYNDVSTTCNQNFGKAFFDRTPASMVSGNVQYKSSLVVNQGSSWIYDLQLKGIYDSGLYSIRITFPSGFKTKQAICEVEGNTTASESIIIFSQNVIECANINKQLIGSQQIRIVNMINPLSKISLTSFRVELLQESSGIILERIDITPSPAIYLQTGTMNAQLVQSDYFQLSNSTYTFYLSPTTLLGDGGALSIIFSSDYKLWTQNCTILKGFQRYSGQNPNCYLNSYTNTYIVDNFSDISLDSQIILSVVLQTPSSQGTFPISVQTLNSQLQVVDQALLTALTNSTYGSLGQFTAHALRNAVKLKAGQSGPLESTFFLKHRLPATNYQSAGKVIINIFPKIPAPSINYGIIKCYFYGNVLASSCNYDDTTYSDRTQITIYTPEDFDYQESEVPITVTTEGAQSGYNDGIPLDPLVQRYLFHYYFYDNDVVGSDPTEVYFQEWISDPFEIPDSDFDFIPLIRESNEYTHLNFKMKQQISLPYGQKNYLIRVTFLTETNAWEIGQAYQNNYEIIEDFPCLLYGNAIKATPIPKCDIYQQTFRDPFIQAYGFETLEVDISEWIYFDVPSIKIANVAAGTKAKIRFSLMEETPGMINPEVELYYKNVEFDILPQSYISYSFNPNIATTLIPPFVDQPTDLRFQWTAGVYDPDYLIYEIDQVGYYDIGTQIVTPVNCDNNLCITFKKKVQQIVIYPNTPLTQSIITNVKGIFRNPNYANVFTFKVRLMRDGVVINKHTFNVKVGSATITTKIFDIVPMASVLNDINTVTRQNEEHEFYIKFTTTTHMPRDSLIKFTFKSIQTQVQKTRHINFCKIVSGLQPYDQTPIQCSVPNSQIFQITHFEDVPAGTSIEIHFRLLNNGGALLNPLVDIETFYGPANTDLIDSTYSIPSNTVNISTNNQDSQIKFKILDEAIREEKREKSYIGPVIVNFSTNNIVNLKYIKVKFDTNFKTPRSYGTDALICLVNEVRFLCTYTINPMLVTIDMTSNTFSMLASNKLAISTEYVSPLDGILHPSVEGFYPIHIEMQDTSGLLNQATRWMFIKAPKLQFIYIQSIIRNQGRANMFYINFKITKAVTAHASGGRIQIEFPTIDPMGNPMFDLALGGYQNNGDDVGCRFVLPTTGDIGIVNTWRCRLIKSQRIGNPAIVEIINFSTLAAGTEIQMWIAKVFNPSNYNYPNQTPLQVMDANISINIFLQNTSTGVITYIHYDTYNVFMDIRDDPTLHDAVHPYSSQAINQVWEAGSKISSTKKSMINQVWYDISPFVAGDFYIVELPNTSPDVLQPDWTMATCSTFYDWCLTFPQINWVVMHINSNLAINTMYANNDVFIQLLPQSVPQITTTYKAYVWQNRFFVGYVTHQITPQQWLQLVGTITNTKLIHLDSAKKLVKGRKRVEVNFNFTTTNYIPSTGAIQIRFPTRILSIQSHCRSSITVGSGLYQASGTFGNVGCLVQDSNTWVITGFSNLNALTNVKVSGTIDLPNDGVAGYIGDLDVITYGTHEYSNIYNVGRIIDKSLAISNSGITIDNFDTKQIEDIDILHIETQALRLSATSPMTFKFKVGQNILANQGRVRLMFYQYSQLSFNDQRGNPFQYQSTSQYVCNIQVVLTQENYGCKVESIQLINKGLNQIYYQFQMIPNSDLMSTTEYLFTMTTINGNGQDEGLVFPNSGLPYKIDISMSPSQPSSDTDYTLHEHLYYQVYGTTFAYLKFTSYITLKNEMNLFIVEFQPGQVVRNDDTLIIELPTASIDLQYYLFADDGGLGLNNLDLVKHDIIDMSLTYPNPTMECRILRGLQIKGIPLKIMCSNFMSNGVLTNIGATDQMKVAFNILNPAVTANHYSIPAQVYIQRNYQNANEIILWDIVENAFYIHFWSPQVITAVNGDFNLGPVTTTVCNINTDFKFRVRNTQNLIYNNDDAYILRFNFEMKDPEYLHKKDCAYVIAGALPHNCAALPNLKSMIVWPNVSNDLVAPMQVQTTNNKWWTNSYRDEDDTKRAIVGYACYVRELWSEKVIYQDLYPDIQPQRVNTVYFDLKFKGELFYFHTEQQQDFQFFVTAPYWYNVERVAIVFPSNIGWQLVRNMCNEGPTSDIQIDKCWFDNSSGSIIVWIDVAFKSTYVNGDSTQTQTLVVESHMETFNVPATATLNPQFSQFNVKFYTWSRDPTLLPAPWDAASPVALAPATEKYVCYTDSGLMRPGETFPDAPVAWDTTWKKEDTIEFDYEYHRYNQEFVPCFTTQRAPIRMEVIVPIAFSSLKGTNNFHTFDFQYGKDIQIPTPVEKKDYVQDKLICWVNNDRVKCENDDTNKKIRLYFQTPIAIGDILFVFITAHDTNDITKDGFSYIGAGGQYQWYYEMNVFGSTQIYYGYSQPFPIFYNTSGGITCPHRGIEEGGVAERSTLVAYQKLGLWVYLRFARPDILGVTFNFKTVDEDGRTLPTANFFLGLESGSQYPCSRGLTAGIRNNVRCIYEKGDANGFSTPHRIHVFDFNYQQGKNEVFGFLFDNVDDLIEYTVEAWGGTATYEKPYGNLFMGSLLFDQWIGVSNWFCQGSCPAITCDNSQRNCNYVSSPQMVPKYSAYMKNNVIQFKNFCQVGTQTTVILEVVLQRKQFWDSSYEEVCEIDPRYNVKDMFIFEQYQWQANPALNYYTKKAFLYYDFANGQTQTYEVGYFKCKHYREPIIAYTTCGDSLYAGAALYMRFETNTHTICENNIGSAECSAATANTNESKAQQYTVDITPYNNDLDFKIWHFATANYLVLAMKIYDVMNNALQSATYEAVLTITAGVMMNLNTGAKPSKCYVIEGLRMSDPRKLGEEPYCQVRQDPNSGNGESYMFYISNWDTVVQNEYVRILFVMNVQNHVDLTTQVIPGSFATWMNIYANAEAYNSGQNGHMNSRDQVTISNFYMCYANYGNLVVNSFNYVGASTLLDFDVTIPGSITWNADNWGCDYTQCIELTFFGLQDYFYTGNTRTVEWRVNGALNACQGFAELTYKGYWRWTVCFDWQWSGCVSQTWTSQVLNFRIYFNNDQIRLDRNFWWVHMRMYEISSNIWPGMTCVHNGWERVCANDEWVDNFQIGTSLSVNQLSTTYNSISEVDFTITGLYEEIGLGVNVNRILIMEFKGVDWPSNPIYDTQTTLQQIDCLCSINGDTFQQRNCIRRIRQVVDGRTYDPVVLFYFSAPTGSTIRCSIPEIIIGPQPGAPQPRYLSFKIIRPSIYEWYGKNGEQFNSRIKTDYTFILTPNSATTDLTILHDPSVFYVDRTTTEQFFGYYDMQISNIHSLNQPYVYIRHAYIGPLMTNELCSDPGLWILSYTKIYNLHSKVIICQRKSSSTTNAVIGAGLQNIYFEKYKTQSTADYFYYVYVYSSVVNGQLLQQQTSVAIPNAQFQPIKSSFFETKHFFYYYNQQLENGLFAIQLGLRGFLWNETRDGGRVEIYMPRSQITGITPSCTARIEKEFQYILWCYVDNRNANYWVIVVHNLFTAFSTNNFLNVYFYMTNPSGATNRVIDYTAKFYYNYQSDTDYKVEIQDDYTQTDFDFSQYDASKIRIAPSQSFFYGFKTKQFQTDYYELRYYIKFLTQKNYRQEFIVYNNDGCMKINYNCNSYLDVRVREHDTTILGKYREIETRSRTYLGDAFAIYQSNYRPWKQNALLEVIISTRGVNAHIGLWKQTNPYLYNAIRVIDNSHDPINFIQNEQQQWTRYPDHSTNKQTDEMVLQNFYFTNQIHKQPTSFQISIKFKSACVVDYPRAYFELKFPILTVANIIGATQGGTIPCQISLILEQNPTRVNSARCIVQDINTQSYKGLMVRIEEVNRYPANSILTFAFDDWVLPDSTNTYTPLDIEFNLYVGWAGSATLEYNRYFLLLKEMILIDGMHAIWNNLNIGTQQLNTPNNMQYGAKNVEYNNNVINSWPQTTTGYNDAYGLFNTAGQKMRLIFYHGFIGGNNTPDSLTYYDQNAQLPLLWFNRKTNSAYISAPSLDTATTSITFSIKNAANPYPYQRDTWNADGRINYQLYMGQYWNFDGDGFRQTNIGELDLSLNAQWAQFLREIPTITIDTSLSHQTDVVPTYNYAKDQTFTMRFRITHTLTQAVMQQRQIKYVVFDFTQGVKSIRKCYIQSEGQNSNIFINRYAQCQINYSSSRFQLNLWNIAYWEETKAYQMFVEMTTDSNTIIYQMSTIVSNGEFEHFRQIIVPMIQFSNTHYNFNYYRFTEGKYIPNYYELFQKQLYSNTLPSLPYTWRLRFRFILDLNLSYITTATFIDPMTNADYLQILFPPLLTNAYVQTDPTQWLMCYFVPEISLYDKLALPFYSKCKLDTSGNPYFYKLTAPRDILTSGKAYVIHIRERRIQGGQFALPTTPTRSEFIWQCFSPIGTTTPSYDTFITRITNRFSKAKINHLTTTSEDYDVVEITFVPTFSLNQMTETYLQVEIDSIYFQKAGLNYEDFDIINTYSQDGLGEFINGMSHSYLITPPFSTGYAVVNFGQHSNFFANMRVQHVLGQDFIAGTEYVFKIPMVRNPKAQHLSLSYKISTIKINTKDQRVFTLEEYWFVNHAYIDPVHTDMTSANFQMNSLNDYVQQTTMDLSIQYNYNVAAPQRILLKWDNNNKFSVDRTQFLTITISGCLVEVFDKIYLIMITPVTYSSSAWSIMSLGTNFISNDYSTPYGFWYTYICNNQLTKYYYNPTNKWLKALTDLTPKTLLYKVGYQTINSVCQYRLTINTPTRIPRGGYIQINLSNELDSFENLCYTLTTFPLVSSVLAADAKYGPLNCQRVNNKVYIIKGFEKYTASTSINVDLYLKNVNSASTIYIQSVAVYGTSNPQNIIAVSQPVPSTVIYSNNPGMIQYDIVDQVSYPIYAKEWQKLDFEFTLRSNDLTINQNFQLKLTLPTGWVRATGTKLDLKGRYKRNDPQPFTYNTYPSPPTIYKDWTTSKYSQEPTKLVFDINVDTPPLSHYTIPKKLEYIFSVDSERADVAFQEGLYNIDQGLYNFFLEAYDNTVAPGTLLERTYNEYYVKPREDISDTFRVSVLNTAIGEKTMFRFTFTMNYSKAQLGDEIWIQFQTQDRLYTVFKDDLGLGFTDPISSTIGCSEKTGFNKISNSRLVCYIFRGSNSNKDPRGQPVIVKIPIQKDIAATEQVDFWIANIENPVILNQVSGIKLSIRRDCRDDSPHFKCILYHAEHQYRTTKSIPLSTYYTSGVFTAIPNTVTLQALHNFQITPVADITSSQYILIQYPSNHKNQNTCTSMVGECIEFPEYNWVLFKSSATIPGALNSSIQLNNMINGWHRRNPSPTNYFLLQVFSTTGVIAQPFKITHNYYDYYMINTIGDIENTQTYDPIRATTSYFLKEGYENIGQIDVINMDIESEITYFRLEKPSQINGFNMNYCNATLSLLPTTDRKPYPLRYDCEIHSQYILLIRTQYFKQWDTTFKSFNLRIYFKFTIDNEIPPSNGILPGPADPFLLYGCVFRCDDSSNQLNNLEYSHVTKSIIAWDVSKFQQPNLNTAGFYTESFYERQAHINDDVSIYMLIKPNTNTCDIDKLVFTISDDFIYPNIQTLDQCTIQGTKEVQVNTCSLTRRQGLTQVTLTLAEKLGNMAKIVTLADSNGNNLFQAPPYPGSYIYPVKLEMFCGSQLVETQYTNITNVRGEDLDVQYVKIKNSLDSLTPQLYDIEFKTGKYPTPLGYNRSSSSSSNQDEVYSHINVVFEWIGDGYTIHAGYAQDLGMNKQDGDEVGCAIRTGLTLTSNNRLVCKIYNGSGSDIMPMIQISGYEEIPPNTTIGLLITNIQSIAANLYTTIKVGIEVVNPALQNTAYFYNLVAYIPDLTTILNSVTTSTATLVVTGNSQVNTFSNYQFTITTNTKIVKLTDYIGFAFPSNFINSINYDPSQISCLTCSSIYVFPSSSMIYIRPSVAINPSTTITLTLNGIPNPNYAIQGSVQVQAFTFIDRKIDGFYNAQFTANFVPSNIFDTALVEASSQIGGDPQVTYTFTFILGHEIPTNGSVSIDFPIDLYSDPKSMATPFKCTLKGDVFDNNEFNQSSCKFVSNSRLAIILQNTKLSPTSQYQVVLEGVTNPNISYDNSLNQYYFIFSSHFNQNPVLNQIIAQKQAQPPLYYVTTIKKCSLNVTPSILNIDLSSIYSFKFTCNSPIKNKSELQITFPDEYRIQNDQTNYLCSSFESTTLYTSQCTLQDIQGKWVLTATLRNITQSEAFTINVQLNNPSIPNSAYPFSAQLFSFDSEYAETDNSGNNYANIVENDQLVVVDNLDTNLQIALQNVPINAAEPAFYIFKTPNVNKLTSILETEITFPKQFSTDLGKNLKCYIYQTNDSDYHFNIENILQLRVVDSATSKSLINVPCSVTYDYTIQITGVQNIYSSSQMSWNYILVSNVFNPGQFYLDTYKIIHSSNDLALWIFEGPLYYQITDVAKQLDIKYIQAVENSTSIESAYIFQTEVIYQLKKNIRVGIMVDLPDQFDMSLQDTNITCYSSITQNLKVQCNLYNSTILAQKNVTTIDDILQLLYVDSLINPSSTDPCSDSSIINPYFKISLVDLTSNEILATQQSNSDLCLKYSQDLLYIKIDGPSELVRGLSYSYQVEIEKPADILKLVPDYDDVQFEIIPNVFVFQNYQLPAVLSFQLNVKTPAILGQHSIKFIKYEIRDGFYSKAGNEYQLPPLLKFEVSESTSQQNPKYVIIEDFTKYSTGGIITAFIKIPEPPAQNIYLNIDSTKSTKVIINPTRLLITPQTESLNYTIQYISPTVLSPIPIYYSLVSNYPLIHQLSTNVKYLIATASKIHNGLNVAKLELVDQLPVDSYYQDDIGQPIDQSLTSTIKVKPEILNITTVDIKENQATLNVITSQSCTLQYLLTYKNSIIPSQSQILTQTYPYGTILGYGSGQSDQYFPEAKDNTAQFVINNLSFQTSYDISFICYNGLGYSSVTRYQFMTSSLQSSTVIHLTLTQNTDPELLLKQLSQALRVNLSDLALLTSSKIIQNQGNRTSNDLFSFEVAIAPQTNGFNMYSYLSNMTSTNQINFLKLMNSYVVGFQTYRVEPFSRKYMNGMSKITDISPLIESISFYAASISVRAWEDSIIYGLILEDNNQTIISQQVILGLNQINLPVEEYWAARAYSNSSNSNKGLLNFDNLKDGTTYRVYLTATNVMPYPEQLKYYRLADDQILSFNFTTPYNYNLERCQMLDEIRSFNERLSEIIEQRFETEDESGYCRKDKNISVNNKTILTI